MSLSPNEDILTKEIESWKSLLGQRQEIIRKGVINGFIITLTIPIPINTSESFSVESLRRVYMSLCYNSTITYT
jgi:hypothetical protein